MEIIQVIEEAFSRPPLDFQPANQTLKNWAMYCLRDKGFKVVYAQNADFAIEPKNGEKLYFKVANSAVDLDRSVGWIVWDSPTKTISVIPPQV